MLAIYTHFMLDISFVNTSNSCDSLNACDLFQHFFPYRAVLSNLVGTSHLWY